MKAKIFTYVIAGACILGAVAFGQSLQLSNANVTCVTTNQFEVQCDGIAWVIRRSATTTPANPVAATTVNVVCRSPDAQRNESPTWTPAPCSTPTATPKPTATP